MTRESVASVQVYKEDYKAPSNVRLPLALFAALAACQPSSPTPSATTETAVPTLQPVASAKSDDPPMECRVHSVELITGGVQIVTACRPRGVVLKTSRVNTRDVLGQRALTASEWERASSVIALTPWLTVANCTIDESDKTGKHTLVIAMSEKRRRRFHCSGLPQPLKGLVDVLTDLAGVPRVVQAPGVALPTLDRIAPPQDCSGWGVRLERHQKHGSETSHVRCVGSVLTITSTQSASPNDYSAARPRRVSQARWQALWSQLAKAGWNRLPDCVVEPTVSAYVTTSITIHAGAKRQRTFVCHGGPPGPPHGDLVQAIGAMMR